MKKNMGITDRIIRIIVAIVILILDLTTTITGTWAIILSILGIYFLLTSFLGLCPIYLPFKISTAKKKD